MGVNDIAWDRARVGYVYTVQYGNSYSYDVKMSSSGAGFICADAEHAQILSMLAMIIEHLKIDIDSGFLGTESKKKDVVVDSGKESQEL